MLPPLMDNHGMFIASLGNVCRWLGQRAEELGVEVFPGFAAAEVLFNDDGSVKGVATGDMGIGRNGQHKDSYAQGMELHAKYTLFAEGCRGSLSQQLMSKFNLRDGVDPQVYGLGVKELWQVPKENHQPGLVVHSQGWPLPNDVGGGSFLYHFGDGLISVGFVTHLSYANPHLSPFEEMQRFKTHPAIRGYFEGGAPRLRCARHQRRWPAVNPELAFRAGADRLHRGFRQPAAHQGLAQRDENRDARGRSSVRGTVGRSCQRRTDGLS
jgi:electron-transferring-flavoprotein dehydrogenase